MPKIVLGLIAGAVLGLLDGLSAWFTPEVRDQMLSIALGSTGKGLLTGLAAGWAARRWNSMAVAVLVGFAVGLALSYAVASMGDANGNHYYLQIVLPGAVLGLIVGFASQRFGRPPVRTGT
jgi:peptidoglycan/LPS O-acetylase OafA/YrhL